MRTLLLILLVASFGNILNAQSKDEIKEIFWGKNDEYKSAMTIPDKWKNESAVVIYKNINYQYQKSGTNVTYIRSARRRIKLLDQAAVKEFSEFSFRESFRSNKSTIYTSKKATETVGVKVVKPDGTETEVNIDAEAITTDEKKKVAIPNLEIGDIIDFYKYSAEPFKTTLEYGFKPVEETLGDVYPIMDLKIIFKTENDFFVNFATYNGAPELKEVSAPNARERHYELAAKNIDKNEFPQWFYPLAELPCYKFQVYFARSGKFENRAAAYLPEKENIIKKEVLEQEIFDYYEEKFRPHGEYRLINRFLADNTFSSDEEKVRAIYYFVRHTYFTRYIEGFMVEKKLNIGAPWSLYNDPRYLSIEEYFVDYFTGYLKNEKIDYEVLVGTARYNGKIEDLLIERNASVLIKVKTSEPIYLQFFTPFTNADQIDYNLENSDAYVLEVSNGRKVSGISTTKLPSSNCNENITNEKTKVSVSTGNPETVAIAREVSQFGHNKEAAQAKMLYFFDYIYEDYEKYGTESVIPRMAHKSKAEQYKREFDAYIEKQKEKQKEEFEKLAEDEFGLRIDDHSLEITATGRFGKATPLTYKEGFTVNDGLIKKVGSNYVFEIGKLIGSQTGLEEKEYQRTNNIYMSFPRSYENEIVFTVPAGYTVTGLDKLTKKVENSTGGFVSSATIEGDKLIVKTKKYYTNYYEPAANWEKMTAFLDAAYQFTQEKVLIKKV